MLTASAILPFCSNDPAAARAFLAGGVPASGDVLMSIGIDFDLHGHQIVA